MKHIKRAAALVLAVMLSLCLSLTAFAATETFGTLTVTGKGLTGKTVTAIRMFTANVNDGDEGKLNGFDSYSLENAWLGFFKDSSRIDAVKTAGKITDPNPSDQDMKDAAVAYVNGLSDAQLASLAHDAQKWVRDTQHKDSFSDLTKTSAAAIADTTDSTKGVATITNLTSGYYLVFPEMGSTGNAISKDDTTARGTDAMLVNIPKNKGNTAATIKSTYPTVDKKVQTTTDGEFKTDGNAQIGDKVTYQLTATVPDMTDYDKYTFKFVDTLTKGLSYTLDVTYNIVDTYRDYDCDWPTTSASERLAIAKELAKVAVPDETGVTNKYGKLTFSNLKPGLYLVARTQVAPANQEYILDPYLVTLPIIEDGEVFKDIEVDEKFAHIDGPRPSPTPSASPTPESSPVPTPTVTPETPKAKLPQTGQLNWPIPVLIAMGLSLILLGGWLQRKSDHEK